MDFEELKREEKLNDLRRREKFENAVRQLGHTLQVKGTYEIRNDDDANKCMDALMNYLDETNTPFAFTMLTNPDIKEADNVSFDDVWCGYNSAGMTGAMLIQILSVGIADVIADIAFHADIDDDDSFTFSDYAAVWAADCMTTIMTHTMSALKTKALEAIEERLNELEEKEGSEEE